MATAFAEHVQAIIGACEILEEQYVSLGIENATLRRQLASVASRRDTLRDTLRPIAWRGAKPLPEEEDADVSKPEYNSEGETIIQSEGEMITQSEGEIFSQSDALMDSRLSDIPAKERWAALVQRVLTFGQMTYWTLSCWLSGPKADTDLAMMRAATTAEGLDEEGPDDEIMVAFRIGLQSRPSLLRRMSDVVKIVGKRFSDASADAQSAARRKRKLAETEPIGQKLIGQKLYDSITECCGPPLHPAGKVRITWNFLSILWICFDAVMVSLEVFDLPDALVWKILEWFARCFWTFDILISFRTGFVSNFKYETRTSKIAKNYLKTWFLIDLIALLPDYVSIAASGEYNDLVKPTKLIRVLRLVRVLKMRFFFYAILETMNSLRFVLFSDMVAYSLMVMLWVHVCGCLWYAVGKGSGDRSWLTLNDYVQMELPHSYFVSVQWAASQLQGNVDIKTADDAREAGFCVSIVLASIVVLAIFISKLTNMMIQLEQASRNKARHLRALQDYLSMYRVSTDVSMKVKRYAEQKLSIESKQLLQEQELITILPKALRRSLLQEVRGPRLEMNNPFFQACKQSLPRLYRQLCCDVVHPMFSEPDTLVYTYGESCFVVLFLMAGDVTYDHYNNSALGAFIRPTKRDSTNSFSLIDRDLEEESMPVTGLPSSGRGTNLVHLQRQKSTFNFQTSMSKMMFRERLANQGLVLDAITVDESHCLCEASLWTRWSHKGDLVAQSHASFLAMDVEKFAQIVEFENDVKRFGSQHAFRFCRVLNSADLKLSDLLTSEDIIFEDVAQKQREVMAKKISIISGSK